MGVLGHFIVVVLGLLGLLSYLGLLSLLSYLGFLSLLSYLGFLSLVIGDVVDYVDTTEYHLELCECKNSDWRFLDVLKYLNNGAEPQRSMLRILLDRFCSRGF